MHLTNVLAVSSALIAGGSALHIPMHAGALVRRQAGADYTPSAYAIDEGTAGLENLPPIRTGTAGAGAGATGTGTAYATGSGAVRPTGVSGGVIRPTGSGVPVHYGNFTDFEFEEIDVHSDKPVTDVVTATTDPTAATVTPVPDGLTYDDEGTIDAGSSANEDYIMTDADGIFLGIKPETTAVTFGSSFPAVQNLAIASETASVEPAVTAAPIGLSGFSTVTLTEAGTVTVIEASTVTVTEAVTVTMTAVDETSTTTDETFITSVLGNYNGTAGNAFPTGSGVIGTGSVSYGTGIVSRGTETGTAGLSAPTTTFVFGAPQSVTAAAPLSMPTYDSYDAADSYDSED
ncbi:MAG: hypothetical protein M1832_001048 [Thelocarpon impressellum]|nr:MAG: hypothetical protein M1832_001048 [Thelocarpon impressellum]